MTITSGLSGNEIYCLAQKNYRPGTIVVGNSVYSLGMLRSIVSSFKAILGGEITQFTHLIRDGREAAFSRLVDEAKQEKASGVTGVSSELIFHGGNIEFLSLGSAVHSNNIQDFPVFTSSADGQELYAQIDAGYKPICFAFGNVAYSIGIGRGLIGGLKTLKRGEIKEFSDMFNSTRHLALDRIMADAKANKANAVLGIRTSILPFGGVCEMLMVGTAARHESLYSVFPNQIITSDMTNVEMWNMANMGYVPLKLVLGTSIYSLGLIGGISSVLKSFVRGEITELTRMIYDAREQAIGLIRDEAKSLGADDVVGVKTHVYQLQSGLIEFLAIGTAVKKISTIKTESSQLPPQAIIVDKTTYYDATKTYSGLSLNLGGKPLNSMSIFVRIFIIIVAVLYFWVRTRH